MKPAIAIAIASAAIIILLASEIYRRGEIIAEISTLQSATAFDLQRARFEVMRLQDQLHLVRTGNID